MRPAAPRCVAHHVAGLSDVAAAVAKLANLRGGAWLPPDLQAASYQFAFVAGPCLCRRFTSLDFGLGTRVWEANGSTNRGAHAGGQQAGVEECRSA